MRSSSPSVVAARSIWVRLVVLALLGSVMSLVQVALPGAAVAAPSAATGTAGVFVPLVTRLVDAGSNTGGIPQPTAAGAWMKLQVAGVAGIPSSGVSAVALTLTAANATAQGIVDVGPTSSGAVVSLIYHSGTTGLESGSTMSALAADGSVVIQTQTSVNLYVDVQGYYTDGNGITAPGGFVPVTPQRIYNQGGLSTGHFYHITGAGSAGVPANASAIFATVSIRSSYGTDAPWWAATATTTNPPTSYPVAPGVMTATGANLQLDGSGNFYLFIGGSTQPVGAAVDIVGYYTASAGAGTAFTPAATRVYDSRNVGQIPANGAATVQVAGVAGVPAAGSGLQVVSMNLQVIANGSPGGGAVQVWGSDQPQPVDAANLWFPAGSSIRSDLVVTKVGADGAVKIRNASSAPIDVVLDVDGWFSGVGAAVPSGQNQTQRAVTLQASSASGGAWVTYRYRVGTTAAFQNVPVGDLSDSGGGHPSSLPVTTSGSPAKFTAYTWNIASTLGASTTDALVQVEPCYAQSSTDANPICWMPSNITYSLGSFGAANATTSLGPGTLSLLTGDYQVSATDAAIATSLGGLSIGRSLTTLVPAAASTTAAGVFGPGWSANLAGPDAGNGDLTPIDYHTAGYVEFTDASGYEAFYQATSSISTYPITFTGVGDNAGDGESVTMKSATSITMADPDGTLTTWTGSGGIWQVAGVTQTGSSTTSTYSYNAAHLVTRILAPVPAGVPCASPDTTPGCRSLTLTYGSVAGATRLVSVSASLPTSSSSSPVEVEHYDYNTAGQLSDTYDPRITPHLVTSYTYDTNGRLATLTQPGQNPWSFSYDSSHRLSTVTRTVPVTSPTNGTVGNQTATSTVVYNVPNGPGSGGGRPDLSASATAGWGESSDLPIDGTATAIFGPDHVPAGTTPGDVANADWPYATLHYLDVNGREVNTASYGAGQWLIDTTAYDTTGNDIWDLTANNRAQALNPTADTDAYVASQTSADPATGAPATAIRANLLASSTTYNPLDPAEVTDTYGPTHPVKLSTGTTIDARTHTHTSYDEGAPNSDLNPQTGAAYRLPTTVVTGPYNVATTNDTSYPDAQTTTIGYAAVGSMSGNLPGVTDTHGNAVAFTGWSLGQATSSTTQMGATASSSDLTTTTVYDTAGRTIQARLPGDSGGTTPRTTNTTYYTATGSGTCASAASAGLTCQTQFGGEPATGRWLPAATYTYNQYGEMTKSDSWYADTDDFEDSTDVYVTNAYDPAGRLVTSGTSATNAPSDNSNLPTVTTTYDPATGQVASTSTGSESSAQTLSRTYNSLGAIATYSDATGNQTVTGYDVDGRMVRQTDGQGTTTWSYDSGTDHRGLVTSEDIGTGGTGGPSTFAATYDASGALATETYPGGITATTSHDNADNPTKLSYANGGTTLLKFTQTTGSAGTGGDHTVAQTSAVNGNPYSSQTYTDDAAGRLTTVQDTVTSSGSSSCATRVYAFNADSDRTSLKSYPAGSGGACSTSTTPNTTNYTYDQADRLASDTTGGAANTYAYDALGRTSTLPAGDATGIGSHNPANGGPTGDLTLGYYTNDMVATQAQGTGPAAASVAFGLDPDQNRISTQATTTAAGTKTLTNHYDDASDSPAWTSTLKVDGATVTRRYLDGIDGDLDAVVSGDGTLKLDLSDMNGDVVAAVAPDATSVTGYSESTEYGVPRNPAAAADDYGWKGGKKRSSDDLAGLVLMGVRLYNPTTGRFLSVDPVPGGNPNPYTYPLDPVDNFDLTGQMNIKLPGGGPGPAKKSKCGVGCHLRSKAAHTVAFATGSTLVAIHVAKHAPEIAKSVVKINRNPEELGEVVSEWRASVTKILVNAKSSPGYPRFPGLRSGVGLGGLLMGYGISGHHKN